MTIQETQSLEPNFLQIKRQCTNEEFTRQEILKILFRAIRKLELKAYKGRISDIKTQSVRIEMIEAINKLCITSLIALGDVDAEKYMQKLDELEARLHESNSTADN